MEDAQKRRMYEMWNSTPKKVQIGSDLGSQIIRDARYLTQEVNVMWGEKSSFYPYSVSENTQMVTQAFIKKLVRKALLVKGLKGRICVGQFICS